MSKTKDGRYTRLGKLGEGTYGQVFKAQDKRNFNIVAVKSIALNSEEEGIPSNAVREISLLKQLRHPNIVRLLDVLYSQARLSLVFEYCEQDLSQYITGCRGHPDPTAIQSLMYQMLQGVAYCHQHMVLHRDLKPQNILLDKHMRLKIADFGLARPFGVPVASYSHEVVTLWYRAPDVLLGSVHYNAAIDMWSVGCIFGELLLTVPLFCGSTVQSQLVELVKNLGAPTEEAWPALVTYPHYASYASLFEGQPTRNRLHERLSRAPSATYDLMSQLLQYAPEKRLSASQALEHPYFNRLSLAIKTAQEPHSPAGYRRTPQHAPSLPPTTTASTTATAATTFNFANTAAHKDGTHNTFDTGEDDDDEDEDEGAGKGRNASKDGPQGRKTNANTVANPPGTSDIDENPD